MSLDKRVYISPSAMIALLVAIKGYYLLRFGPIADSNDLPHYLHYASLILGDQDWLSSAGIDEYMRQTTLLRMIGYPFWIAIARFISEEYWTWIVVVSQLTLSLYASLWVWRLGVAVSGERWVGFLAGLAFGTGLSLRFDQMVLTDSPTASLLIIAFSILSIVIIAREKITLSQALSVGALIMLAFLLRDSVRAIAFFYVPLVVLSVWHVCSVWGGVVRAGLMIGPVIAAMLAYQTWNEIRTGERFITTIPHSALMISMMSATQHGTDMFTDDTPLDTLVREEFKLYHFREILFVVRRMQLDYGFTEPQVLSLVQDKYKAAWLNHPGAMLREYVRQISPRQVLYVISPLFSDLDMRTRVEGQSDQRPSGAGALIRSLFDAGTISSYGLLALYAVQVLAALTVTASFFVYPIVLWAQAVRVREMPDLPTQVMISLWLFYWGMVALVALSEFTPRFLMPVMPIVAVIGFAGLAHLRQSVIKSL